MDKSLKDNINNILSDTVKQAENINSIRKIIGDYDFHELLKCLFEYDMLITKDGKEINEITVYTSYINRFMDRCLRVNSPNDVRTLVLPTYIHQDVIDHWYKILKQRGVYRPIDVDSIVIDYAILRERDLSWIIYITQQTEKMLIGGGLDSIFPNLKTIVYDGGETKPFSAGRMSLSINHEYGYAFRTQNDDTKNYYTVLFRDTPKISCLIDNAISFCNMIQEGVPNGTLDLNELFRYTNFGYDYIGIRPLYKVGAVKHLILNTKMMGRIREITQFHDLEKVSNYDLVVAQENLHGRDRKVTIHECYKIREIEFVGIEKLLRQTKDSIFKHVDNILLLCETSQLTFRFVVPPADEMKCVYRMVTEVLDEQKQTQNTIPTPKNKHAPKLEKYFLSNFTMYGDDCTLHVYVNKIHVFDFVYNHGESSKYAIRYDVSDGNV